MNITNAKSSFYIDFACIIVNRSIYLISIGFLWFYYPNDFLTIGLNLLMGFANMYRISKYINFFNHEINYREIISLPIKFISNNNFDFYLCYMLYITCIYNYFNITDFEYDLKLISKSNIKHRLFIISLSLILEKYFDIFLRILLTINSVYETFNKIKETISSVKVSVADTDNATGNSKGNSTGKGNIENIKPKFKLTLAEFELQREKYPCQQIDFKINNIDQLIQFAEGFSSKFIINNVTNTDVLPNNTNLINKNPSVNNNIKFIDTLAMIKKEFDQINHEGLEDDILTIKVTKDDTEETIDDYIFQGKLYVINLRLLYNLINTLKKLQKMIGLKEFKNDVLKIIMMALHYKQQNCVNSNSNTNSNAMPMMHVALMGAPGVGKTELSKIIGEIFIKLNLVEGNIIYMAHASNLIGSYVGFTENKTQKIIDKAIDNILIIDEADSICDSELKSSFGRTAINILNANLDKRERNFKCIITGYTSRLKQEFFSVNEGLNRRFRFKFEIKGYESNELKDIFVQKVLSQNYQFNFKTKDESFLTDFFSNNKNKFPGFAGDVENFVQKLFETQMFRVFGQDLVLQNQIIEEDLYSTIQSFSIENDDNSIIKTMYG
jgi:SpoVK/Ycf46/Vps4 family AAA+-type ATPase